jgi:hypothetical protein
MNETEELLTKELEIETTVTVDVSVYDLLKQFDEAERRELARELVDEVSTEYDDELYLGEPSLGDEYKLKHFAHVHHQYSLQELEQLLPDKEGAFNEKMDPNMG